MNIAVFVQKDYDDSKWLSESRPPTSPCLYILSSLPFFDALHSFEQLIPYFLARLPCSNTYSVLLYLTFIPFSLVTLPFQFRLNLFLTLTTDKNVILKHYISTESPMRSRLYNTIVKKREFRGDPWYNSTYPLNPSIIPTAHFVPVTLSSYLHILHHLHILFLLLHPLSSCNGIYLNTNTDYEYFFTA